jgi:hypothetical protein
MENKMQQVFANLNQEIEHLEAHARRIEELLPRLHPKAQEQWKVTEKARLAYEEELRALLNVVLGEK